MYLILECVVGLSKFKFFYPGDNLGIQNKYMEIVVVLDRLKQE